MIETPEDFLKKMDDVFQNHMESAIKSGLHPDNKNQKTHEASGNVNHTGSRNSDPLLERLRNYLDKADSASPDVKTLLKDTALLLDRYEKLDNRLNKIVTISDTYQAQLRDLSLRMEMMAHTDVLTGLPNRRDILDRMELEFNRARRYGTAFSLILLDVDDFKTINDNYGHDKGDEVLKLLAVKLRKGFRKSDTCARWGGEEFLILCPESDEKNTWAAGEKCRKSIASSKMRIGDITIKLTLSGGVSEYRSGISINDLLRNVDNCLYKAKRSGKNQILLGSEEEET